MGEFLLAGGIAFGVEGGLPTPWAMLIGGALRSVSIAPMPLSTVKDGHGLIRWCI